MLSSWRLGIHRLRSPGTASRVGRVVGLGQTLFIGAASVLIRSPRRCTSTLPPLMRLARLATWRAYSMGCVERLGEADGGEQREVGVLGLFRLSSAVGVAIDGENAVGVLGDHLAPLVEAEHPGGVAVLFGAVPGSWARRSSWRSAPRSSRAALPAHRCPPGCCAAGMPFLLAPAREEAGCRPVPPQR